MIKAAIFAAVVAVASAQTDPSLFEIQNVWDNQYSKFLSGFAYGGSLQMIKFDPTDTCLSTMFSVSDAVVGLVRINKLREPNDWFTSIPIKIGKLAYYTYNAFTTCLSSDPNLSSVPFVTQTATTKPVYDLGFFIDLGDLLVSLIGSTLSQVSTFDWFFFGRILSKWIFTGAFVSYNIGYYYF